LPEPRPASLPGIHLRFSGGTAAAAFDAQSGSKPYRVGNSADVLGRHEPAVSKEERFGNSGRWGKRGEREFSNLQID